MSKLHHEIACLLCCDQVSLKLGCTDNDDILKLHILEIEVYVLCVSNFIEGLSDVEIALRKLAHAIYRDF